LPGGQLRQEADPVEPANHPVGQLVHDRGNELTSTIPVLGNEYNIYEPVLHAKHSDASSKAHFPAAHKKQNADPDLAAFPTMHVLQVIIGGNVVIPFSTTASCTKALPSGQSEHTALPEVFTYLPVMHAIHNLLPEIVLMKPAGQF
jgi:hypothetical protein